MNRRGLTLIELLVATALFLMAVGAFSYVLKTGLASVDSAVRLNHAVYLLQAEKETILSLPFDRLPSLNASTFADGAGKIQIMPALSDLTNIQLELEWDPTKVPLRLHILRRKYQ